MSFSEVAMFFILLKTRLAYMFTGLAKQTKRGKAAGIGMLVLTIVLLAYLAFIVAGVSFLIFFVSCRVMCDNGYTDVYFAIAALLSFLMGFLTTVTAAKTQVFESGDNEMLLAMPIPHRAIILSRLASLLVVEYVSQLLVVVPCAIAYIVFYGIQPVTAALFVLGFLLLPLITLTVSCFVGWLISLITSRLGRLKNIFSIMLYILFFGAYFLGYSHLFSTDIDVLVDNISAFLEPIAHGIRAYAPPMMWLGRGIAGSPLYFLLFAASAIIPALLMLWIMSRTFVSMASRGKHTVRGKYTAADAKVSGLRGTLVSKELARTFSSPGYLMNISGGLILTVVAVIFSVVKADMVAELMTLSPVIPRLAPAIVAAVTAALASMNTMSATSISIEGKTLWILKSLPICGADVLRAKMLAHMIFCTPPPLIAALVIGVSAGVGAVHIFLIILLSLAVNALFASFGLIINLLMPRFDWVNETAVAKQGGSTVVAMFSNMFIAAVLAAVAIVPTLFVDAAVGIIVATIISAGAAALMYMYLVRGGGNRFERLSADS